ncbi:MAG TPA: hypothetical protein VF474_05800 [Phenylobacterium sp.]
MIILERIFNAGAETIRLEVDQPKPDGDDFRCDFRLQGAGLTLDAHGMGVDGVQALLLTLQRVHIDLLAYRRDTGLQIEWLEMRDLGLPLPPNVTAVDFDQVAG